MENSIHCTAYEQARGQLVRYATLLIIKEKLGPTKNESGAELLNEISFRVSLPSVG